MVYSAYKLNKQGVVYNYKIAKHYAAHLNLIFYLCFNNFFKKTIIGPESTFPKMYFMFIRLSPSGSNGQWCLPENVTQNWISYGGLQLFYIY